MNQSASTSSHQRRGGRPRHRSSERPSDHGSRHQHDRQRFQSDTETFQRPKGAPKMSFWQKLLSLIGLGPKPPQRRTERQTGNVTAPSAERPPRTGEKPGRANGDSRPAREGRVSRPVIQHEVTSGRLYVGNLSYDASENDLKDLFGGVGEVQNVEIVVNRATQRSKGFGFVEMLTTDQAKRAVSELHDKEFMGRKMLVTGAKPADPSRSLPADSRSETPRSPDGPRSESVRSEGGRPSSNRYSEGRPPRREPREGGPSAGPTKGDVTTGIIRREQLANGMPPAAGPVVATSATPSSSSSSSATPVIGGSTDARFTLERPASESSTVPPTSDFPDASPAPDVQANEAAGSPEPAGTRNNTGAENFSPTHDASDAPASGEQQA